MTIIPTIGVTNQGFIPVRSYEHYLVNQQPIYISGPQSEAIPVPAYIELALKGKKRKLFLIGIDPGNSGAKYAMYSADGKIITHYIPAVVASAKDLATGNLVTTYQQMVKKPKFGFEIQAAEGKEDAFIEELLSSGDWIGEDAIEQGGTSLPTGSTRERVNDPRYAPFLMQGLIDLFINAGYPQGEYDLIGCWGARMEEIKETSKGLQLDSLTKTAIDSHFLNRTWKFQKTDEFGDKSVWAFTFHDLVPGPQSLAGFNLWQKRPDGQPAQDIVHRVVEIDFGAFDLHRLFINCKSGQPISATRERVGNGMIIEMIQPFAQRLKEEYNIGELDDATAFKWFMSGEALVGGFAEDISHLVAEVRGKQIPHIIARAFRGEQRATDFYRMKGGGVLQMQSELTAKMNDLRRKPETYLIVTDPTENAAGLLATLDLMVRGRK